MRTDTKARLQVPNVLHEGQDLEAPIGQAEQDADAHVVDPGFHGAVHGGDAPVVVLLLACALERAEFIEGQGRDVGIHAADFALAALDTVDRRNRVEHVLEALVRIRLARHQQDALVALVDQDLDLAANLFL